MTFPPPTMCFIDIETDGLSFTKNNILEFGAIAITGEYEIIAEFNEVIPVRAALLDHCITPYVREMHNNNGLLETIAYMTDSLPVLSYSKALDEYLADLAAVEDKFIAFLEQNGYEKGKVVVCGHSIATFDIPMIREQMPKLAAWFSHRTLDFGAIGRFLRANKAPLNPSPEMPHRALLDCRMELGEAQNCIEICKKAWGG